MRYRLAQFVIILAACSLVGGPHLLAQTASVKIQPDGSCPSSSGSNDTEPSGSETSIANVTFSGFLQLAISDQDQIADSIKQQTYEVFDSSVTDEALERTRLGWQDRGYFKVKVNGYATTLTSSPGDRRISLNFHVDEGLQYSLGGIAFKNNRAVSSTGALRALFPIDNGDVFSRKQIAKGLVNLSDAYGEMGYVNFTAVPETRLDDEKKLIYLNIDIDEGKQFYVEDINVLGLDEPARQGLLKDIPITRGQIYNSRLWEASLLKSAVMFPECRCAQRQPVARDEGAALVTLTLDFRACLKNH